MGTFGLKESDFDDVVRKSKESSSMKGNPVALSDEELKAMLRAALCSCAKTLSVPGSAPSCARRGSALIAAATSRRAGRRSSGLTVDASAAFSS